MKSRVTMKYIFMHVIMFYQKFISPIKPPTCRFYPTCSTYCLQSYERFGTMKGTYLSVKRIAKCHPFHPGGLDFVPEKENEPADKTETVERAQRTLIK